MKYVRATLKARPGTLAEVFAVARTGDTIELASGDYGLFAPIPKAGRVTVRAARGATARMEVGLESARNLTLDGLTFTGLELSGRGTRNITVKNSRFDRSQAIIFTRDLANANVVFDHNVHDGFVKCSSCYEGRIELVEHGSKPSGVTIRNSTFRGGNSDGIQNGGNGVRILSNTFSDIRQVDGAEGVHSDAIQLYGSLRTVIRGNHMKNVATGVMAPDGTDHEVIEDNTIATAGYPYAITLGGDDSSIIRDNRLVGGSCDYSLPCGTLRVMASNDGKLGKGTVIAGNTLGRLVVEGGSKLAVKRDNRVKG